MMQYYGTRSSNGEQYTTLKLCIEEILTFIKPSDIDRDRRLNTTNELAISIQSNPILQGITVQPFGSFVSNLYSKWGDLDISINLNDESSSSDIRKKKKNNVLKEIRKVLQRRGIGRKIQFIPQARVPLLNYESTSYNISCDLSVENRQGFLKSKIIQLMTNLDERFTHMVLLIKEWAKAQNINDPKTGTLNSYSLCLLVIFHLQTCEPAILPPVKEIYNGNISDFVEENEIVDGCGLNIQKIISNISIRKNQSCLSELLISFFDKYSEIEAIASEYAICPFSGRWEKITNNPNWSLKSHYLFIEDPFEQPDNSARSVCKSGLKTISDAFKLTCQRLSPSSRSLSDRNALLVLLSRPLVSSQLGAPKKLSQKNSYGNSSNSNQFNQQVNHYYANNRSHQNDYNNNNTPYGVNQNRVRNQQVRSNGVGHVNSNNNNRTGYSYTSQNYERVDPNYNINGGINGSSSNQSHRRVVTNLDYNRGMNGNVHSVGYAELVTNDGLQNRVRYNGSGSGQTWKPKGGRNYLF